jgi:iron(III) transport system permease protein
MEQIPASVITAARVSGASLAAVVRRIILPMTGSTWVRVWLMLFAGVVFELPVSQLLYPPGGPTLAVSIVHQFHNTAFGTGAALTVLSTAGVGLLSLLFLWLSQSLGPRRRRSTAVPAGHEAVRPAQRLIGGIKGEEA